MSACRRWENADKALMDEWRGIPIDVEMGRR